MTRLLLYFTRRMLETWASCADDERRLVLIYFGKQYPAGLEEARRVQKRRASNR